MSFKAFESSDRMEQTKKSNRIVIKNYTFEDYPQHNKPNLSNVGIPIHAQISAHMHPYNKNDETNKLRIVRGQSNKISM